MNVAVALAVLPSASVTEYRNRCRPAGQLPSVRLASVQDRQSGSVGSGQVTSAKVMLGERSAPRESVATAKQPSGAEAFAQGNSDTGDT